MKSSYKYHKNKKRKDFESIWK